LNEKSDNTINEPELEFIPGSLEQIRASIKQAGIQKKLHGAIKTAIKRITALERL
jgi:hypothetical protein